METPLNADADIVGFVRDMVRAGHPDDTLARRWAASLATTTHTCCDSASACAKVQYVVDCRRRLLDLLQSDEEDLRDRLVPVAQHAATQLQSMWRRVRYEHRMRVLRRPYTDAACGAAPFRDHAHGALHLRELAPESRPARSGRSYRAEAVEPFVSGACPTRVRAGLYRGRLEPRRLRACDMWYPNEQALVGQWGVFARTAIAAHTCVGVYGGQLMDAQDLLLVDDDRYLITASVDAADAAGVSVNGESLLSLANTLMLLDPAGRFAGHPDDGYNLEVAKFPARFTHGWRACVPALFTTRDIAPGEELRWHYGLAQWRAEQTKEGPAA